MINPVFQLANLCIEKEAECLVHIFHRFTDPCFWRALICASSRLRVSTIWPRLLVKALRRCSFAAGKVRPASGLKAMKRAINPASIRSVLARVPQLAAKALICAGGNGRAVTRFIKGCP